MLKNICFMYIAEPHVLNIQMHMYCINACTCVRTYMYVYWYPMCVSCPVSPFLRFVSKVQGTLLDTIKMKRRQQKPSTRMGGCILGTLENGCQTEH